MYDIVGIILAVIFSWNKVNENYELSDLHKQKLFAKRKWNRIGILKCENETEIDTIGLIIFELELLKKLKYSVSHV